MYRDAKEELKRLEEALLAEDPEEDPGDAPEEGDFEELLDSLLEDPGEEPEDPRIYRNFSNQYGRAYNADPEDPEPLSRKVQEPSGRGSNRGLILTVLLLLGAIGGVLLWWLFRFFL